MSASTKELHGLRADLRGQIVGMAMERPETYCTSLSMAASGLRVLRLAVNRLKLGSKPASGSAVMFAPAEMVYAAGCLVKRLEPSRRVRSAIVGVTMLVVRTVDWLRDRRSVVLDVDGGVSFFPALHLGLVTQRRKSGSRPGLKLMRSVLRTSHPVRLYEVLRQPHTQPKTQILITPYGVHLEVSRHLFPTSYSSRSRRFDIETLLGTTTRIQIRLSPTRTLGPTEQNPQLPPRGRRLFAVGRVTNDAVTRSIVTEYESRGFPERGFLRVHGVVESGSYFPPRGFSSRDLP